MYRRAQAQRKARKRKKQLLGMLEGLLIFLLIALVAVIIVRLLSVKEISTEEQAAADHYQGIVTAQTVTDASIVSENPEIQPEILALMEQNSDAVGLLHFEGDRTLYVCQTTDNVYYMNHCFDKSEDPAGMIYMDYRNSLWPRSDNLILYGHNMRDGSRFGTLKRFEKKDYILKYPIFQLVEKYETVDYVPFAVFHTTVLTDDETYYPFDQVDFVDEADFNQYIYDVKSRSVLDIPIEVEYGDKLLTLATCHSGIERGRLVIVCREVKDTDNIK